MLIYAINYIININQKQDDFKNFCKIIYLNLRQLLYLPSEFWSIKGVNVMARKGENIYKRKDGRWEGRYIIGYTTEGKAQYKSIYGRSYAEIREKLAICKSEHKTPRMTISSALSLAEWFKAWYASQNQIKQSTKTVYQSYFNKHIKTGIGKVKLKRLNADILQGCVDKLSGELAPRSVHTIFAMLKSCLQSAYEHRLIADIYSHIRLPKIPKAAIDILSKEQQKRLEDAVLASGDDKNIGILLCLYTGMRIGELCALKWENVDFDKSILRIRSTLYRVKIRDGKTKTKVIDTPPKSPSAVRDIPIPEFLKARLLSMKNETGYVINNNGKYIEPAVYSRRLKRLLKKSELPDIRYHDLRHTFAGRALEIGMDVKTLSELLGHASVSTTLNLYGHSLPEHKQHEIERLAQIFSPS